MTTAGKLFNYGFDRESPRYDWVEIDEVLFNPTLVTKQLIKNCLHMVQEQFDLPFERIWRVHILRNGEADLSDFTLPSSSGRIGERFLQENLPQWVQDSLSVLMIVDQGVTLEGVGKKINDSIFYLMETPEIEEIYGNEA